MLCNIKQHVCCSLVIDAIEKSNAAYRHIITLVLILFIYKCSNTTDKFSIIVLQYPTGGIAMPESFIFLFIKNFVDIFIKRTYIMRVMPVYLHIYPDKIFC